MCPKCTDTPIALDVGIPATAKAGEEVCICVVHDTRIISDGSWWIAAQYFVPIDNSLSETTIEDILKEPIKTQLYEQT